MITAEKYEVKNVYKELGKSMKKDVQKSAEAPVLTVEVPGSKSITNRALLIATLAKRDTKLTGVLFSDDSRHFLKCVQELGVETEVDEDKKTVIVHGCGGELPKKQADIYVGSAGTAARFLTAALGISKGIYGIDSSEQMRKRPMQPLFDAITELGCSVEYKGEPGHFPVVINANGVCREEITINIDKSSQFMSALLVAAVLCDRDFEVNATGSHGMAYIDMTVKMMEQFGVSAIKTEKGYKILRDAAYWGRDYAIEPDASAACYFYAMCPLLGIAVCVPGIKKDSLQGDVEFINMLVKMGCRIGENEGVNNAKTRNTGSCTDGNGEAQSGITLLPPSDGSFTGIEIDMSAFSDQAITLAAIAPYASSPTTIRGIGHIRHQESDRLSAMACELKKMGIKTEEGEDFIKIYPGKPQPAEIDTYDDHRMAMGFSLTGLRADGIVIKDPACCKKTFEDYFDVLDSVIARKLQ